MLYKPSRDQARQFLIDSWHKRRSKTPATALETLAADVVEWHREYHALLEAPDAATREWTPEQGETNPFLHMSLHLAIEEQLSIDQPPGIRKAFSQLEQHTGDRHLALHVILDCLGETMWRAQREGKPPDGEAYLECIQRRASH
ncbi:MAG: DUF1841 family protein [Rhodocyclaceae bacterium]|nr:DUF1841 family protein [Rhodocyclaceae bacterium]